MWIRKSIMLGMLVMSSSMYGFGSSDLEDLKGLFGKRMDTAQEIELREMSDGGRQEDDAQAQEGSMYDMARALLAAIFG